MDGKQASKWQRIYHDPADPRLRRYTTCPAWVKPQTWFMLMRHLKDLHSYRDIADDYGLTRQAIEDRLNRVCRRLVDEPS